MLSHPLDPPPPSHSHRPTHPPGQVRLIIEGRGLVSFTLAVVKLQRQWRKAKARRLAEEEAAAAAAAAAAAPPAAAGSGWVGPEPPGMLECNPEDATSHARPGAAWLRRNVATVEREEAHQDAREAAAAKRQSINSPSKKTNAPARSTKRFGGAAAASRGKLAGSAIDRV